MEQVKKKEKTYEATTFNMDVNIKAKAKIFIAKMNQESNGDFSKKSNLGKLINDALAYYLSDVKIEGID